MHPHPTSQSAFHALRRLIRLVPDGMRGKLRLARYLTRPFANWHPVRIPDRFGNALWCPSIMEPIAAALYACGVYEPDTIAAIVTRLKTGGTYLDVGANVGALALAVAAQRPDARVICVEADPEIAATLRRNVAENSRSNVTVIESLIGSENKGDVPFYRAPSAHFGMGSVGPQFESVPIYLQERRLDDLLDDLGCATVDVVKLDIEGAELGALKGLGRRVTGPNPPAVIFEFADWAESRIKGQEVGDAQRFLLSNRYRLLLVGTGDTHGPALPRPMTKGGAMILALPPEQL